LIIKVNGNDSSSCAFTIIKGTGLRYFLLENNLRRWINFYDLQRLNCTSAVQIWPNEKVLAITEGPEYWLSIGLEPLIRNISCEITTSKALMDYNEDRKLRILNLANFCKNDKDITLSGGWCLFPHWDHKDIHLAPGYPMAAHHVDADPVITEVLFNKLFGNSNVTLLDLGSGVGQYGHWLRAKLPNVKWIGYDGAANVESFTKGFVNWADLTVPLVLELQSYDWVLSLEVGEHVPVQFEDQVFANIGNHARCGVILSWAVPGQGGHFHVNLRSNSYVISKMALMGLIYDEEITLEIRNSFQYKTHFRKTIFVFRRGLKGISSKNSYCTTNCSTT
jgi:2-polyprenyl-3-methyl-5-hydroxy-6-metoxy-1,4-benzoquinol methylase